MAGITNSDEANRYYKIVNDLIDQYITKWKIKPSNLGKYLNPKSEKFKSFLSKNKLDNISGMDRIIRDVIEDRIHMEKDGILTYEKFSTLVLESIYNIGDPSINHEKIIADYFHIGLDHINLDSNSSHKYTINSFGDIYKCIVYSKSDINKIYKNMENESYKYFCDSDIIIDNYDVDINLKGKDVVSEDAFRKAYKSKMYNTNILKVVKYEISKDILDGEYYELERYNGYYIWRLLHD
jgi:hypothetical protein